MLVCGGVLLALLQVFRAYHGRQTRFITNDGDWYYAYAVSLYFDCDLDLSNQMGAWASRTGGTAPDLPAGRPTPTAFTVGPALLWVPALAAADVLTALLGGERDGYGLSYQLAAALATLTYGLLGVLFAFQATQWWLPSRPGRWPDPAGLAAATSLVASPALYYLIFEPTMSHGLSLFATSWLVWRWLATTPGAPASHWLSLGLLAGLCALIRPQDGLLLLLPLAIALGRGSGGPRRWSRCALLAGGALAAFAPQAATWTVSFGRPLVIPQGTGFMQWLTPRLPQVWFSPHHGLFTWTPIWLLGVLGLALAPSGRRALAVLLAAVFLLESYANACARDWWAGDAFGARRFVSLFPVFTLGLGAALSRLEEAKPGRGLAVSAVAAIANLVLMALYVTGRVPHG